MKWILGLLASLAVFSAPQVEATTITVNFQGSVLGNELTGSYQYDSDAPVTGSYITLLSFTATLGGVTASADGIMRMVIGNDGSVFGGGMRDFVEVFGQFSNFSVGGTQVSTLGLSLFQITSGATPTALSSPTDLPLTQADYDAFPSNPVFGDQPPGGTRTFVNNSTGGSFNFFQGSLDSITVQSAVVPLPAAGWLTLAGLAALAGLARRRTATAA